LSKKYEITKKKIEFSNLYLDEELVVDKNNPINDFLLCKVCFSIVKDPKSCQECDEIFCGDCIKNFSKNNNKCPNCRNAPFKEMKINKFNKIVLNELKLFCPQNCKQIVSYENLMKHLDICEKITKIYKCKLCNWEEEVLEGNMRQVYNHDIDCSAMIQCPFCFNDLETSEFEEHTSKFCEEKIINCEICKIKFPTKFKNAHDEFFCKKFELFVDLVDENILKKL